MLAPAKSKRPTRSKIADTTSFSAPVGGWNARDSIAAMKPIDAVGLVNLFPATSEVMVRLGYSVQSSGLPDVVETVFSYTPTSGSNKLFGISDGDIYDCTTPGAVGAAVVTGLTNSRWQFAHVTTAGGSFMYLVNGADKPLLYDGSTWVSVDGASTPAITGVTTTNLSNITLFKNRVWFIEKNTLKAWYLPTGAVGGAANVLDLSSVALNGGNLVAIGTWTLDAGYGVDDYLVFATSEGDIIVYRGTDPSSATTFALTGVWSLGSPIGARCFLKYAGDLLIITQDGVLPLAGALQSSRLDPRVAITDKIQWATSEAISKYGENFGWQLCYFAKNNMLFLNVPVSTGSAQEQYVMNTITKAWCRFTGWAANCFEIHNDDIYFGGDGVVCKAWDTFSDNGTNIDTDGITAFQYFKAPASLKHWRMARAVLRTNGKPSVRIGVNTDFRLIDNTSPVSYSPSASSKWDSAIWDTSLWGGDLDIQATWKSINSKPGYTAALRFKSSSSGIEVKWLASDFAYEFGGVVG